MMFEENSESLGRFASTKDQSYLKGQNVAKQEQKREQFQVQLRKDNRKQIYNKKRGFNESDKDQSESCRFSGSDFVIDQEKIAKFPDGAQMNIFNVVEKVSAYLQVEQYQLLALETLDSILYKNSERVIDKFLELNLDQTFITLLSKEQHTREISKILINLTSQSKSIPKLLSKQLLQIVNWLRTNASEEVQKNAIKILANVLDEGQQEIIGQMNQINQNWVQEFTKGQFVNEELFLFSNLARKYKNEVNIAFMITKMQQFASTNLTDTQAIKDFCLALKVYGSEQEFISFVLESQTIKLLLTWSENPDLVIEVLGVLVSLTDEKEKIILDKIEQHKILNRMYNIINQYSKLTSEVSGKIIKRCYKVVENYLSCVQCWSIAKNAKIISQMIENLSSTHNKVKIQIIECLRTAIYHEDLEIFEDINNTTETLDKLFVALRNSQDLKFILHVLKFVHQDLDANFSIAEDLGGDPKTFIERLDTVGILNLLYDYEHYPNQSIAKEAKSIINDFEDINYDPEKEQEANLQFKGQFAF